MRLEQLAVQGVRNLKAAEWEFDAGLNFLVGANGSGKTSMLEAISLLCRSQSFRTPNIRNVISHDADSLALDGQVEDEVRGTARVLFRKNRVNETDVRIDGVQVRRASELVDIMPIQVVTASSADLITGVPKARRRYLDWGLACERSGYLNARQQYQRVLRQRNSCLRHERGRQQEQLLDAWDEALAELGQRIVEMQAEYVDVLQGQLQEVLSRLPEVGQVSVTLKYHPGWSGDEDALCEVLRSSRQRDVKLGRTGAGPHAADVHIDVGKRPAAQILSRGEAKFLAQALSLAQADRLYKSRGRKSLFLVDELAAEVDATRRLMLLSLLQQGGYQAVAASAIPLDEIQQGNVALGSCRLFHVEQGHITQAQSRGNPE